MAEPIPEDVLLRNVEARNNTKFTEEAISHTYKGFWYGWPIFWAGLGLLMYVDINNPRNRDILFIFAVGCMVGGTLLFFTELLNRGAWLSLRMWTESTVELVESDDDSAVPRPISGDGNQRKVFAYNFESRKDWVDILNAARKYSWQLNKNMMQDAGNFTVEHLGPGMTYSAPGNVIKIQDEFIRMGWAERKDGRVGFTPDGAEFVCRAAGFPMTDKDRKATSPTP